MSTYESFVTFSGLLIFALLFLIWETGRLIIHNRRRARRRHTEH